MDLNVNGKSYISNGHDDLQRYVDGIRKREFVIDTEDFQTLSELTPEDTKWHCKLRGAFRTSIGNENECDIREASCGTIKKVIENGFKGKLVLSVI